MSTQQTGKLDVYSEMYAAQSAKEQNQNPSHIKVAPAGFTFILGLLLVLFGIATCGYFWLVFNVIVTTPPITVMGQSVGGGQEVSNIGLLFDRADGILVGALMSLIGTVTLGFDSVTRRLR
jgi:hypothetical protein